MAKKRTKKSSRKSKRKEKFCLSKVQLYHVIKAAKGGKKKKICPHAKEFVKEIVKDVEKSKRKN